MFWLQDMASPANLVSSSPIGQLGLCTAAFLPLLGLGAAHWAGPPPQLLVNLSGNATGWCPTLESAQSANELGQNCSKNTSSWWLWSSSAPAHALTCLEVILGSA